MSCVSPTQEVPLPCSSPSRPTLPQPTTAFARNLLSLYLTFNLRFNNSGIEYMWGNTATVDSPPSLRPELPRFASTLRPKGPSCQPIGLRPYPAAHKEPVRREGGFLAYRCGLRRLAEREAKPKRADKAPQAPCCAGPKGRSVLRGPLAVRRSSGAGLRGPVGR